MELHEEIRRAFPKDALRADFGRGFKSAIKLNCLNCMGSKSARKRITECPIYHCAFWRFRPYGNTERPQVVIPKEELEALAEARVTEAQRAAGQALAARRQVVQEVEED